MGGVEDNQDADKVQLLSYQAKFCLAATGMLCFPLLHQLIGLLIRRRCSWIEKGAIFRISTRVVSGIQALIVIIIAVRSLYLCKNIMTDEDPYIHAYIWFAVSYFPYDIVVMYIGYAYKESWHTHYALQPKSFLQFFKREPILVLHHIIFLAAGLPISEVYKNRLGDFFLACFLLAEGSTPFYNMRGVLKEAGIENGYLFTINGLLFVVTFLLFRVLSVPFMFVRYSYHADIPVSQVPFTIPYKCTISCLLFFSLQFYWFSLICRGLRALYLKKVRKAA